MTTVGADVEALRQLAQMFTDNSSKLTGDVIPTINSRLNSSGWVGEDADSFKADWHGHLMGQLNNAATQLSDATATLNRNADEQEQASSIAGASSVLQSGLSNPQPANNDPAAEKAKHWWEKAGDSIADWWNKPIEDKLHDISYWTEKASAVCTIAAGVLALTGVGAPVAAALFTAGQVLTIASASTDIAANGIDLYNGKIGWAEFGVSTVIDGISIAGARGSLSGLSKAPTAAGAGQTVSGNLEHALKTPAQNTLDFIGKETAHDTFNLRNFSQGVSKEAVMNTVDDIAKDTLKGTVKESIKDTATYHAKYADEWLKGDNPTYDFNPYQVVNENATGSMYESAVGSWSKLLPLPEDPNQKSE